MRQGKYIVIDGVDGCGKGTQIDLLRSKYGNDSFLFVREPGGNPYAEKIRNLILDSDAPNQQVSARTEFLLFFAARNHLLETTVGPALDKGKSVISDRADSSTWAFQIRGGEESGLTWWFQKMRIWIVRPQPDLYIILDLPAEVAQRRLGKDSERIQSHFDQRKMEFHERVREAFREFASKHPVLILDAEKSPENLHEEITRCLSMTFPGYF
ncbi:MAG: dTMP kinase [Patescibacteria group bacterium]